MVQKSCFFAFTRWRESRQPSLFFMFLQFQKIFPYNVVGLQRTLPNEEGYFQNRLNYLKPKHVKIRSFYFAICSKWERNCLTKLCRTQWNANQEENVRENFAKTNQTVKPNFQGSLCKARNEART